MAYGTNLDNDIWHFFIFFHAIWRYHGDVALGIKAKVSYKEQIIDIEKGDLLFVYSDGVTEARSGKNEFFGESRLMNLLLKNSNFASVDIGKKVLSAVKGFIGDERPSDDLSMILLKRIK